MTVWSAGCAIEQSARKQHIVECQVNLTNAVSFQHVPNVYTMMLANVIGLKHRLLRATHQESVIWATSGHERCPEAGKAVR